MCGRETFEHFSKVQMGQEWVIRFQLLASERAQAQGNAFSGKNMKSRLVKGFCDTAEWFSQGVLFPFREKVRQVS
jgi:hypothetical protein